MLTKIACLVVDTLDILHNIRGNDLTTWLINPELRRRLSIIEPNGSEWNCRNEVFGMGSTVDTDRLLLVSNELSQLLISRLCCSKSPLETIRKKKISQRIAHHSQCHRGFPPREAQHPQQ